MEEVTIKKMEEIAYTSTVYDAIHWALNQELEFPKTPKKPIANISNSSNAKQYAIELEEYEKKYAEYEVRYFEYKKVKFAIENVAVEFIKEMSGLNEIPEQYRDKVYSKAYEYGHSSGLSEVYNTLVDLVEIFN